jgi:hypothetical protein
VQPQPPSLTLELHVLLAVRQHTVESVLRQQLTGLRRVAALNEHRGRLPEREHDVAVRQAVVDAAVDIRLERRDLHPEARRQIRLRLSDGGSDELRDLDAPVASEAFRARALVHRQPAAARVDQDLVLGDAKPNQMVTHGLGAPPRKVFV